MKPLDKIGIHRLRVPLTVPYRLAFGPVEHFDTIIAEAVDGDGNAGFGEATILTGYTDETIDDSWRAAKAFAAGLAAAGGRASELIEQLGVKFPFTATAFGTALEMLSGSALLALDADASVPLVGLLNAKDGAAMYAEVTRLLEAGYRTIKVKVGFDVAKDIALVAATQKAVRGRAATPCRRPRRRRRAARSRCGGRPRGLSAHPSAGPSAGADPHGIRSRHHARARGSAVCVGRGGRVHVVGDRGTRARAGRGRCRHGPER